MSRQSMASSSQQRNLTLTEELEKLEQSITLTLQEIDHNFSQAHRIVTSSILPVVEQYARHSDAVWEGSKFWKEFFEASANIRLSKYEEDASALEDDEEVTATPGGGSSVGVQTPRGGQQEDNSISDADYERPSSRFDDQLADDLVADSPSVTRLSNAESTSRQVPRDSISPDQTLDDETLTTTRASTPRRAKASNNRQPSTPGSAKPSPFIRSTQKRLRDTHPIMHRVLDKNIRIMATPMTKRRQQQQQQQQQQTTSTKTTALDSSPLSPDLALPQLRSDLFSPERRAQNARGPRTPGISVLKARATPTRNYNDPAAASARKALFNGASKSSRKDEFEIDWDSDSDGTGLALSPPKTMQFAVPPSRLMQTPAKEASRRIVEDLLLTAGAASVTDEMQDLSVDDRRWELDGEGAFDDSPSMVRVARDVGNDEF